MRSPDRAEDLRPHRVAVVGGGITGLTVAYRLAEARPHLEIHLYEAQSRLGGKIHTHRVEGPWGQALLEAGPDALYAFKPAALRLAEELGLAGRLVRAAARNARTLVLRHGRLRVLPEGMFTLMPSRLRPFVQSDLISWPGKLRMAAELLLPPRPAPTGTAGGEARGAGGDDESVGAFVRRRLGPEAVDALADPLLAGIHAADPWRLSLLATYPQFRRDELAYGGLARAMLARRLHRNGQVRPPVATLPAPPTLPSGAASGSPFLSLEGGLEELVDALRGRLQGRVVVHLGSPVQALQPVPAAGRPAWRVVSRRPAHNGAPAGYDTFDAVVLAVPAHDAAALLRPWDNEALSGLLDEIPYASVAIAALLYPAAAFPPDSPVMHSSGVLIPGSQRRRLGLMLTACSWASSKWPHTTPAGWVMVRGFAGRFGDDPAALSGATDSAFAARVEDDLARLVGRPATPPAGTWLFRWPLAMPQYQVGHRRRVALLQERAQRRWPGLFLTGAALDGMSISDCVRQGDATAAALLATLSGRGDPPAAEAIPRGGVSSPDVVS